MNKINILVVDDEKEIRDLIEIYLRNEGYGIFLAEDGVSALKILKEEDIKLVILDIMLPDIDGISVCRSIRNYKDTPIIMLSAKREDNDKISGILNGADDYIGKPFNPLELMVRIKAQLRRYLKVKSNDINKDEIVIEDLKIDLLSHQVYINDQEVHLTVKEFEILKLLVQNRGKVFSSRNIYENIWNEEFYECDSTIMTHIKNLRIKLNDNFKNPRYIKTVWGVGYKIDSN
ncbi:MULTISPECIES: response regulator transcription factor [Clostridium]|uniref:Stage 0 sporulation protein A homolog n=2 Tax=Clostridium TaxID=1485 RepID=A0A7U4JPL3_CLOSG|nr:response regulator transcription factor [Clostridium sporogenes]EJE7236051.1 response regulator transcription factor [Clostridium botulinum]AKC62976.1 regulatory protein VanR [Clostridium sporogenes]AKJ90213.1 DeoR faimly transcriptional regulator [Clostridium sporogenes]KCZ67663.1 regulatory protein VanR [Clostridium sporogenes]MBU5300335.1 response regulator transcription factor [Clostridium sporogenes]